MSMDLLNKLITDIVAVTETVMSAESEIDLAGWQPFSQSVEKEHGNVGLNANDKKAGKHRRGMHHGVHRTVC